MEVKFVVSIWQIGSVIVLFAGAFAVNTFMTKQNDKKIKALEDKTDGSITEVRAREVFVTKELYNNQMKHIDKTLTELKEQNKEILNYVRK
jgi:hypothetical protein